MFLAKTRLFNRLVPTIVGLILASAASADMKPEWKSFNCSLGADEWALMQTLKEKAEQASPSILARSASPATSAAARADEPLPPDFQELKDSIAQANREVAERISVMKDVPQSAEAKASLRRAYDAIQSLSLEDLVRAAHRNPAMRACQLQLNRGNNLIEFVDRMKSFTKRDPKLYTQRLPLLAIINLADPAEFLYSARTLPYEEALESSLEIPNEWNMNVVDAHIRQLFWYTDHSRDDSILASGYVRKETRVGAGAVRWKGVPVHLRASVVEQVYAAKPVPVSQMIAPDIRRNLLFNDDVLNAFDLPFDGSSAYGRKDFAKSYLVGDTDSERAVQAAVDRCFRSFRPARGQAAGAMIRHFNEVCGRDGDLVMLLIPDGVKRMDGANARKTEALVEREFLRLTDHAADVDAVVSGRLMITNRRGFDAAFVRSLSAMKRRSVTPAEARRAEAALARIFDSVFATDRGDHRAVGKKMSQFMSEGGAGLMLSLLAGASDEGELRLTYRERDGRTEVVGLNFEAAYVARIVKTMGDRVSPEARQLIDSMLSGQGEMTTTGVCLKQSAMVGNLLRYALNDAPKRRSAALARVAQIERLVDQSMGSMAPLCKATFAGEFQKILTNAREQAARLK